MSTFQIVGTKSLYITPLKETIIGYVNRISMDRINAMFWTCKVVLFSQGKFENFVSFSCMN